MSLFLISIAFSFLKKIVRNIYFSYFFFKYKMWWYYLSSLILCFNQLSLTIFIIKNQELYSSFCCSERLKKRKEKKLWKKNIYLNILQMTFSHSVNKSNTQSFLNCIWFTFTTSTIHQQIIHIRKDSRILSRVLKSWKQDFKKKTLSWFRSHDNQSWNLKIMRSCL